jgi:alpha-glucosidase (family GH31 glycosyl hydrolase)
MKIIFWLAFVASLSVVSADTCVDVADVDKQDCGYVGVDEQQCLSSNCCWNPAGEDSTIPWCFKKAGVSSYSVEDMKRTSFGYTGMLNLVSDDTGYGTALSQLKLEVVYESASTFRVRINDANNARYEIPQAVISRQKVEDVPPMEESELAYEFTYSASPFTFKVVRKEDRAVLFDLQPNLIYKDQLIQLTTAFPSDGSVATYGLGESTRLEQAIQPDTVKTLWAADTAAADFYTNLYGSFPYYLQLSKGKAHGAMLMNSNGMDVLVNQGSITFRTIGGIVDL